MTEQVQSSAGDTILPQPRGGARTWYEVLEVAEDATAADIKKAYERALALVEGRSIGGYLMLDPLAAESARQDVEAAYAILGNDERRAQYDRARGAPPVASGASAAAIDKPAPAAAAHDDEAKEARAILGMPEQTQPPAEAEHLPRRATPLKFASPITAEMKAVEPPAPKPDSTPPASASAAPGPSDTPPSATTGNTTKKPAIRFEEAEVTDVAAATLSPVHTVPPQAPMPAPTPPPPAPATTGGSLALPDGPITGAFIKELRTSRGLTLEAIADATKIRKPYLKAIEEEDLAGLPARVYLRGFLTQVARVLKVDRVRLAEGYLQFVESKGGAPGA